MSRYPRHVGGNAPLRRVTIREFMSVRRDVLSLARAHEEELTLVGATYRTFRRLRLAPKAAWHGRFSLHSTVVDEADAAYDDAVGGALGDDGPALRGYGTYADTNTIDRFSDLATYMVCGDPDDLVENGFTSESLSGTPFRSCAPVWSQADGLFFQKSTRQTRRRELQRPRVLPIPDVLDVIPENWEDVDAPDIGPLPPQEPPPALSLSAPSFIPLPKPTTVVVVPEVSPFPDQLSAKQRRSLRRAIAHSQRSTHAQKHLARAAAHQAKLFPPPPQTGPQFRSDVAGDGPWIYFLGLAIVLRLVKLLVQFELVSPQDHREPPPGALASFAFGLPAAAYALLRPHQVQARRPLALSARLLFIGPTGTVYLRRDACGRMVGVAGQVVRVAWHGYWVLGAFDVAPFAIYRIVEYRSRLRACLRAVDRIPANPLHLMIFTGSFAYWLVPPHIFTRLLDCSQTFAVLAFVVGSVRWYRAYRARVLVAVVNAVNSNHNNAANHKRAATMALLASPSAYNYRWKHAYKARLTDLAQGPFEIARQNALDRVTNTIMRQFPIDYSAAMSVTLSASSELGAQSRLPPQSTWRELPESHVCLWVSLGSLAVATTVVGVCVMFNHREHAYGFHNMSLPNSTLGYQFDTVCLGRGDESLIDEKHQLLLSPDPLVCPRAQVGGTVLGVVSSEFHVARGCACNAHNAFCNRHGKAQPNRTRQFSVDFRRVARQLLAGFSAEYTAMLPIWLERFPKHRQLAITRSIANDTIYPSRVTAFVKREGALNPLTKARLIQGYSTLTTQALHGPSFAALQKSAFALYRHEWAPGVCVTFASGMNCEDLSRWMDDVMLTTVNARFYERDGKNWDATMSLSLFADAEIFYPPHLLWFVRRGYNVSGIVRDYSRVVMRYKLEGTVKSGQNDTTYRNSLINAMITVDAMVVLGLTGDIIIAGDDCLVVVSGDFDEVRFANHEASFGIVPEARKFNHPSHVSFVSGVWLHDGGDHYYFIPKPGRILGKLFWTIRPPPEGEVEVHIHSIVIGLCRALGNVPVVGAFLRSHDNACTEYLVNREKHWRAMQSVLVFDRESVMNDFCIRYDTTPSEVEDLETVYYQLRGKAGLLRHPLVDKILSVDLADAPLRPVDARTC